MTEVHIRGDPAGRCRRTTTDIEGDTVLRIILGITRQEAETEKENGSHPTVSECQSCTAECWISEGEQEFMDRLGEDAFKVLCWKCTVQIGGMFDAVDIVNVEDALGQMNRS